ncbi:MAG: hypothetical protein HQM08_01765 [Candidatus Riflebacteria bacterium]|nr:hypothetical protein [Candidatus Riflebacteria bacterium]
MEQAELQGPSGFFELSSYFFLLKGMGNLLLVLLASLFLKYYGATELPLFYIVFNLLYIACQMLTLRNPKWKGHSFLSKLCFPLFLACFIAAMVGSKSGGIYPLFLFLFISVYDLLSTQAFSEMAGEILPLRDLKKLLSKIQAAGTAGSILSGLFLKYFLDKAGIKLTFIILCFLLIWSRKILNDLSQFIKTSKTVEKSPNEIKPESPVKKQTGFENASSNLKNYSVFLVLLSFLGIFGRIVIEFLFRGAVSLHYHSAEEMASFMGIFGAGIDLFVFFLQGFFGQWIFSNCRLSSILSTRSLLVIPNSIIALFFPTLFMISSVQFVLMSFTKTLVIPAFVILLEPLPTVAKFMLRKYIGIGDSVANLSAGVFLLFLKEFGIGADPQLFSLVGVVFLSSLYLIKKIDRLYPVMVGETLRMSTETGNFEVINALRHIPMNDRISRINVLLMSPIPEIRYRAIFEAGELDSERCVEMLLTSLINEREIKNISATMKVIFFKTGSDGLLILEEFVNSANEPRITADIIEAFGELREGSADSLLVPQLKHSNHRVRGNAVSAILRTSQNPASIGEALLVLKEMIYSKNDSEQIAAIVIMKSSGFSFFAPALAWMAETGEREIADRAMTALGDTGSSFSIEALMNFKEMKGEKSQIAERILKNIAGKTDVIIKQAFLGLDNQERSNIAVWLKTAPKSLDLELLGKILLIKEKRTRGRLFESLNEYEPDAKVDFLRRVLINEDAKVKIDSEIVMESLRKEDPWKLPFFADMIPALLEAHHPSFELLLEEKLSQLIFDASILTRAIELKIEEIPDFQTAEKKFLKKLQMILHFAALNSPEPAEILDAVRKASVQNGFLHSIAFEFLEERLGKKISSLLLPLMDWKKERSVLYSLCMERNSTNPGTFDSPQILQFWGKS